MAETRQVTKITFPTEPLLEHNDINDWHVWWSKCGTYRIVRSVGVFSEYNCFAATYGVKKIIGRFRTLKKALQAVMHFHQEDTGEEVLLNAERVLSAAAKNDLDVLPKIKEA